MRKSGWKDGSLFCLYVRCEKENGKTPMDDWRKYGNDPGRDGNRRVRRWYE